MVAGILLSLEGDIQGSLLFILESDAARVLVQRLVGLTSGLDSDTFTEIEISALQEIGNIITGAYLSAISSLTKLTISILAPSLAFDMAGVILSVPAIEFGIMGDKILLIETAFTDDSELNGYFILIPDLQSYDKILGALGM